MELKGFSLTQVVKRIDWTDELFSLRVNAPDLSFKAGQYTKLALLDENGNPVSRAYSIVSAPSEQFDWVEFLVVANPEGALSPKLQSLKSGDEIYVGERAHGDLINDTIPKTANDLWLIATGTGVGPFLALLDDINQLPHADRINLVYGVRHEKDLAYQYLIEQLVQRYEGRLRFLPIVSRDVVEGRLYGRVTNLIRSGDLMAIADCDFSPERSFVMLCGNPEMIRETTQVLQDQGLQKYRLRTGGNIIFERYW